MQNQRDEMIASRIRAIIDARYRASAFGPDFDLHTTGALWVLCEELASALRRIEDLEVRCAQSEAALEGAVVR